MYEVLLLVISGVSLCILLYLIIEYYYGSGNKSLKKTFIKFILPFILVTLFFITSFALHNQNLEITRLQKQVEYLYLQKDVKNYEQSDVLNQDNL